MPIPRKILIRVIGAPILLAALGAILYNDYRRDSRVGLQWLLVVVSALSATEFYAFCRVRGIPTAFIAGTVCVAALFVPWVGGTSEGYLQGSLFLRIQFPIVMALPWILVLYVLFKLVFRYGSFTPEGAGFTVLGFVYVGLLVFLLVTPVVGSNAVFYLLFLLAAGKGSDMAAYAVGKTMGRHPMTPVVSPNKTWEGGIAGGVVGTAAGLAILLKTPLSEAYRGVPPAALLFFALVVTIAAQVGDLVKSAFKRWAGVKDSGRLLPEFGGMLDMVDSFLVAAPVAHLGTEILRRTFG